MFKVPEGGEGDISTEMLCFAIEVRQSSGRFSPWKDAQMPSAGVFHSLNPREFTLKTAIAFAEQGANVVIAWAA